MAINSVDIESTPSAGSPVDAYVSTGDNAVTCIWICNTAIYDPNNPTSGLTYLDVHLVKNGDGITNTHLVVNALSVPAGESVTFDSEKIILENGDRVVMYSPAPYNLVATVSTIPV